MKGRKERGKEDKKKDGEKGIERRNQEIGIYQIPAVIQN